MGIESRGEKPRKTPENNFGAKYKQYLVLQTLRIKQFEEAVTGLEKQEPSEKIVSSVNRLLERLTQRDNVYTDILWANAIMKRVRRWGRFGYMEKERKGGCWLKEQKR
ncbi:MAG TPA: hypothetical protein VE090_03285 [Methylomirabilota bacterium]|nr:hypothetical protein [Methylomirabilota bacterium]